jgi:hypothetical protein
MFNLIVIIIMIKIIILVEIKYNKLIIIKIIIKA